MFRLLKLSAKQLRKLHAMGAQIEPGTFYGAKGDAITCQKCGSQSSDLRWFLEHKKTHPQFEREHHYKISSQLQSNGQYRLRRHHKLGEHSRLCKGGECQLRHLGTYQD